MTIVRVLLALAGGWAVWYGASLLWPMTPTDLRNVALWFIGGILLHDALFAPLCAALGFAARRTLPSAWWTPLAYGAACTTTLLLIAVPVIGREHALPNNPSVLNRPYPWGLVAALALLWSLVALDILRRHRARRPSAPTTARIPAPR
ncbi:hypothetical protein IU500_27520 [Nocardia terpenica]|uniref:Uncharacterized protein n=1 Tax=Nocardia terpenica TaxID=455432 RepID=A0A164J591_9NOCA|nr:hypothetical protein [Nocardia terpenica]KZM70057.1 hypothetical protein AWN90_05600 [Nocardia terpenica]MBF6064001.1 hypothetical protein [Nocardia terpenica]MBF6107763.1 hypothetical protein [Nocardia terpenica]MBF6114831.1 hypothetical protein [Nocardia terpenica]MBF6121182.1 hypothetical protein [Nocardia terpenica]